MRFALLAALAGCSFVATEAPRPAPGPTACNREMKPIVADAIVSTVAVLAWGIAALDHANASDAIAPVAVAGISAASAGYGYIQVHRCRAEYTRRPGWFLADMPPVM